MINTAIPVLATRASSCITGNIDDAQGEKANAVTEQGDKARLAEPNEGQPCCFLVAQAAMAEVGEPVDDLHRVGDTHGEHQEGNQHAVGIDAQAHGVQQTQLPDNRNGQRAEQGADGAPLAAAIDIEHHRGDQEGNAEERAHQDRTIDEVAHQFGESGDADLDVVMPWYTCP